MFKKIPLELGGTLKQFIKPGENIYQNSSFHCASNLVHQLNKAVFGCLYWLLLGFEAENKTFSSNP
jgi:hypothetical protein